MFSFYFLFVISTSTQPMGRGQSVPINRSGWWSTNYRYRESKKESPDRQKCGVDYFLGSGSCLSSNISKVFPLRKLFYGTAIMNTALTKTNHKKRE